MSAKSERHAWHRFREVMAARQAEFDGQVPVALLILGVCHGCDEHRQRAGGDRPPRPGQGVSIRFFVQGIPKSMAVGKSVAFRKNGGMHHFQKRTNTEWATLLGQIGREHAPARPLEGPLIFVATFYVPRPASLPKRDAHLAMPVKRPDVDNLFHKLTDQFNGVFWTDDSQITEVLIRKRYALDGRTGVEIVVAPVTNAQVQAEVEQLLLDREVTA